MFLHDREQSIVEVLLKREVVRVLVSIDSVYVTSELARASSECQFASKRENTIPTDEILRRTEEKWSKSGSTFQAGA